MQMLPKQPSVKGPAAWFTGEVYFDVIAPGAPSTHRRAGSTPCTSRPAPVPRRTATEADRRCTSRREWG